MTSSDDDKKIECTHVLLAVLVTADQWKALYSAVPDGALYSAESFDRSDFESREAAELIGVSMGQALHRGVAKGMGR